MDLHMTVYIIDSQFGKREKEKNEPVLTNLLGV